MRVGMISLHCQGNSMLYFKTGVAGQIPCMPTSTYILCCKGSATHNKHSLTLLDFGHTTMVTVIKRVHVYVSSTDQAVHAGLLMVPMCRPVLALWHMHHQTVLGLTVHSM